MKYCQCLAQAGVFHFLSRTSSFNPEFSLFPLHPQVKLKRHCACGTVFDIKNKKQTDKKPPQGQQLNTELRKSKLPSLEPGTPYFLLLQN